MDLLGILKLEMDLLGTLEYSAHCNPNFVLLLLAAGEVAAAAALLLLLQTVDGHCQEAEEGQTCLKKMIPVSFEATSVSNSNE